MPTVAGVLLVIGIVLLCTDGGVAPTVTSFVAAALSLGVSVLLRHLGQRD